MKQTLFFNNMNYFFRTLVLVFLCCTAAVAQVSVCSWNIANLGKSKNDAEIAFMANTLKGYDAIAIVEVVAGPGGEEAVERLAGKLSTSTKQRWGYSVSGITTSANAGERERYAFIWKIDKLKLVGKPWLEEKFNKKLGREPFLITFKSGEKSFTLAAFHAVPEEKHPEEEIPYLASLVDEYPKLNLIFCGDFNCPQSNETAFGHLADLGFVSSLKGQKTSMRQKCDGKGTACLANEFDNFFYKPAKISPGRSEAILFYEKCNSYQEARLISDHVPVMFQFSLN